MIKSRRERKNMINKGIIRASEIGQFSFCRYGYILIKEKGISPQQTLQDLIQQKTIPPSVAKELQQKNIPLNTTVDKVIGQGLLPQKVEKEIIQSNIMLQGTAKHQDIGRQTQAGSMVAEHRGGWILLLLIIIMIIIGFLILLMVRGGVTP